MLLFESLRKNYDGTDAVNIGRMEIPSGQKFGLVGNNGAGKTTLFRLILDLIKPTEGVVWSKGVDVRRTEEWKLYTGSYLDEGFLIDFLTAEEYFYFVGSLHGFSKHEVDERLVRYHPLFNNAILGQKKYIRDLSKGNQKKVGITAALLFEPEILILDEPFANLDPTTIFRLKNLLNEINEQQNVTMLISSHDLMHVTDVCKRIVVLEAGTIIQDKFTDQFTLKELETYFSS
jgi:ABC-2 type transport system ATP-binding protein